MGWRTAEWGQALASDASIVVIMLGTNDGTEAVGPFRSMWKHDDGTGPEFYEADYKDMVAQLKALKTSPSVYTVIPPPLYKDGQFAINCTIVNKFLPPLIKKINDDMELPHPPIDVFEALGGVELQHPNWFADYCHPNDEGYAEIAKIVHATLAKTKALSHP